MPRRYVLEIVTESFDLLFGKLYEIEVVSCKLRIMQKVRWSFLYLNFDAVLSLFCVSYLYLGLFTDF